MNKKPNVLIYMTDQQRATSTYPFNKAVTPNIDKFAKQGVCFAQTHTVAPHCCPARATFFSGLYPSQHGVWNNVDVGNTISKGLYDGVTLFPEDFKAAGYRTYYSGKWHVSHYEGPSHRGFGMYNQETDKKVYTGVDDNKRPFVAEWKQYEKYKEQKVRGEGEVVRRGYNTYTHYMVNEAPKKDRMIVNCGLDILKNRSQIDGTYQIEGGEDAPWLQMISSNTPHDPYAVPQQYLDMYDVDGMELPESFYDTMEDKPALYRKTAERFGQLTKREHQEALRHYLAGCTYQDAMFGEVLKALEETGEAENTIVMYVSDHGDYLGDHGLWCKGLPCFEGAYHIPMIMRWPAGIKEKGSIVNDFTSIADVAPTLLDLCGISYDREMTGVSLRPYLEGKTPEVVQEAYYTQSNGNELYGIQRSVCTKKWKYVYNGFDYDELYDLEADPKEMCNIYQENKNSEIVKELSRMMWTFARKTDDVCVNPYVMVGLSSYGPGILFE